MIITSLICPCFSHCQQRKLNIKRWKTHNCGNTVSTLMKVLTTIENNRTTVGFPSNCVTIFTCRITQCTCTNPGQYWSIFPPELPHIEIYSPHFPMCSFSGGYMGAWNAKVLIYIYNLIIIAYFHTRKGTTSNRKPSIREGQGISRMYHFTILKWLFRFISPTFAY